MIQCKSIVLMTLSVLLFGIRGHLTAQPEPHKETVLFGTIELKDYAVIGSSEGSYALPGSGQYLGTLELERLQGDDINRVLRGVPGVYVREEDGYGLFPNISLRGVDTSRSSKLTLSEDGILSAPAPYSAPAAYYTPTMGRMDAVEVLKGSSQIQHGPHTTGGVINFRSTPIPDTNRGYLKIAYGSNQDRLLHAWVGRNTRSKSGQTGILLEIFDRQTDGFKTIDGSTGFPGSDVTGFHRTDYTAKLSWRPSWEKSHLFEIKVGYTDLDANETYLGLSTEDFRKNPVRRYAASRYDNIKSNHTRTYFRHQVALSPGLKLTSTVYYNKFHRNWFKLHDLRNPTRQISSALFNQDPAYAILTGQASGSLRVRANNRDYYLAGWQTDGEAAFSTGKTEHLVNFGVRIHKDRVRRHQWHVLFEQDADGAVIDSIRSPDGSDGNRQQQTNAYAFYLKDEIKKGPWSFIPGLRYEYLDLKYTDYSTDGRNLPLITEKGNMDVWALGLGVTYALSYRRMLFSGYHRGFATPGPRAHLREGISEETAYSFEAGFRLLGENDFYLEVVLFHSRFNDLIVVDNLGGTGSGKTENAGKVISQGAEISLRADFGEWLTLPFKMPWTAALTFTDSSIAGNGVTTDANSLFAGGKDGNRTPYIPEFQANVTAGLEFNRLRCFLNLTYTGATFTSASNSNTEINPLTGLADARFGRTDSHAVADIRVFYNVMENVEIFGKINNLFDRIYIASRHPYGPRPGAPRLTSIGLIMKF